MKNKNKMLVISYSFFKTMFFSIIKIYTFREKSLCPSGEISEVTASSPISCGLDNVPV